MIEGTYIETLIDNAFDGLNKMFGIDERARETDGTYKGDDPSIPDTNEAWKSGKSPAKKTTRKRTKLRKK